MEKQRSSLIVSISALSVAVFALVVGFSAFSNNATIDTSATVQQVNNFRVELANNSTGTVSTTKITASSTGTDKNATGEGTFTAYNGGTSSVDLKANFTNVGQELTYTFYARNVGEYKAFLNSLVYDGAITCTSDSESSNPGTASMVAEACKTIVLEATVNNGSVTDTMSATSTTTKTTVTPSQVHALEASSGYDTVTVKVKYNGNSDPSKNYGKVDGDFKVSFGTFTLNYATTDVSHD